MIQNLKIAIRSIKRLWRFLEGSYRPVFIVLSVTCVYTLIEGIGIASLIPLFHEFSPEEHKNGGGVTEAVNQFFAYLPVEKTTYTLLVFILILFTIKAILHMLSTYVRSRFVAAYKRDLRIRLTQGLFRSDWEFFMKQKRGSLINDVHSLPNDVESMLNTIFLTTASLVSSLVYICVAFMISVNVTLIALTLIGVIGLFLFPLSRWSKRKGDLQVEYRRNIINQLEQFMAVFKNLRSTVVHERAISETNKNIRSLFSAELFADVLYHATIVGITYFAEIAAIAFLFVGYVVMDLGIARVGILVVLLWRVINRANSIQNLQQVAEHMPALDKIEERDRQFKEREVTLDSGVESYSFREEVAFRDVSYHYRSDREKSDAPSVTSISFSIRRGQMVGLVGESGSGKTTIIDLLIGLLEPDEGDILVDGTPLSDMNLASWRKCIGYVSQDVTLLNDTIENNIRFYRNLTDEAIREAAKQADAHDFIMDKRDGYDTVIGEEGVKLSGGERQRIALSCALAGDPQILILDEATSELDSRSEGKIKTVIDNMKGDRTIVAIAHRISTILESDQIITLQNGRIVEKGTKQKLLEKDGEFKKLYDQQMSET